MPDFLADQNSKKNIKTGEHSFNISAVASYFYSLESDHELVDY